MEGIVNKIKTQNKRAFTLTELLIVVIVIGVLSAVTLPKFNRVIENRKVTEAEEMMSAVRTEQERRCSLDQNYTTKFSNLQDIIASNTTKNYTYSLQKQGISAKSNNADYTLKILSYEDGSYCCEGAGCKKLNKNYPDCAGLSFPESSCVGTESGDDGLGPDPEGKECTDGEVQGSQTCNGCGTQTTQLCVNGKWTDSLGTCSKTEEECKPKPVECPEPKPDTTKECEPCGEIITRSVECGSNGQWIIGDWNAECKKEGECGNTCTALVESNGDFCRTFYGIAEVPGHSFPPELGFDYSKAYTFEPFAPIDYYYTKPEECCCQNQCPVGQWWNPYADDSCSCTPICDLQGDGEWNPTEGRCCASGQVYDASTGKCVSNPWKLSRVGTRGIIYLKRQSSGSPKVYVQEGKEYSFFVKSPDYSYASVNCVYNISDSFAEFSTVCEETDSDPCKACDPLSDTCDVVPLCYKQSEYNEKSTELNTRIAQQKCTLSNYASYPNVQNAGSSYGWEQNSQMAKWIEEVKQQSQSCIQDGSNCYRPSGTVCTTQCGGEAYGLDCTSNTAFGFKNVGKMCVTPLALEIPLYQCVKGS